MTTPGPVAQALWISAPVAVAGILHMVVVKLDLLRGLKVPLDLGATLAGKPIFGPNKTWRGAVFMVAASATLAALQGALLGRWAASAGASPIDFAAFGAGDRVLGYAAVGAVLGAGYILGELPNSFLKRRIDVAPGETSRGPVGALLLALDQADSVVAAFLIAAAAFAVPWPVALSGMVALTLLHLVINVSLYLVGLRREL